MERICRICGKKQRAIEFYVSKFKDGRTYRDSRCKSCHKEDKKRRRQADPKVRAGESRRRRESRASGLHRSQWILTDTRKWDKQRGFECDLDRAFVEILINQPCSYCGTSELIGLDRIDNDLGHTKVNVQPACRPCNMLRRDLPMVVWLRLVPILRQAMDDGLLDEWRIRNKKGWL